MAVLNVVKLKDVWFKENIMAGCGSRKKAMGGKIKMAGGGGLKAIDADKNPGLAKLPEDVRNDMGYLKKGGKVKKKAPKGKHYMPDGKLMKDSDHKKKKSKKKMAYGGGVKKMKNGGKIDGCAMRGKTRGRNV
jgi:hypothetical protein